MKNRLQSFKQTNFLFLLILSLYYIIFHVVLVYINFDFLKNSDSGWYHRVVLNPLAFDAAIQPVYPFIVYLVKSFLSVFSFIDLNDNILMIIVNFFQFGFFIYVISRISSGLFENKIVFSFLLFFLVFPVNFLTFSPRANSLLYAIEFLLAYRLLQNNKLKLADYILISFLPLIHKSSLFTVIAFFVIELIRDRKVILYYLMSAIPTVIYLLVGSYKHNNLFWWFSGYAETGYAFEGLPFGGLLKILIVDTAEGSLVNVIQGLMVLFYIIISLYFLIRELRNKNYNSIVFFMPQLLIAAALPPNEINSVFNYSVLFTVGFLYYNKLIVTKYKYPLITVFCAMSVLWTFYAIYVLK